MLLASSFRALRSLARLFVSLAFCSPLPLALPLSLPLAFFGVAFFFLLSFGTMRLRGSASDITRSLEVADSKISGSNQGDRYVSCAVAGEEVRANVFNTQSWRYNKGARSSDLL